MYFFINSVPGAEPTHSGDAFAGAKTARTRIGADNPDHTIFFDYFRYKNAAATMVNNHPNTVNILKLGGHVSSTTAMTDLNKQNGYADAIKTYLDEYKE
jgi:prepilin-type processing-associated H-X9-DG protein